MRMAEKMTAEEREQRAGEQFRAKLEQLLEKNPSGLSTAVAAETFSVTEPYFCYLVKKHVGRPFGDLVTERRMQLAKELLLETRLPIKQIAAQLGFANESYFDKVFHRYYGFTPNAMRKQGRAEKE